MFFELVGTVVAGIACAGIVMLVNRILGRRLPRWLTPVAAGLGMIGMTISNEYSWFERTAAQLPTGLEVAVTVEEQSWLRPWTQVAPYTKRFIAVDMANARRHEDFPTQRLLNLYFFGRWSPVSQAAMLIDCTGARSAMLGSGTDIAADGSIADTLWEVVPSDDPLLKLACET